jgi:hypothetical protein
MADLLPDSRTRERKGGHSRAGVWWVPVYCAMCGRSYGYVPEENCTFACWLCDPCAETYGPLFGTLLMPDEVMARKIHEAMLEKYGRVLSRQELAEDFTLRKLLNDVPRVLGGEG